ncbi:hypothetical protein CK203_045430 [Vitis vinifera]|uniref:Uncharacterized protein n=1 Tax=Vitis vinifera TaxID=29760 RepID=A0A438HY26_VITVI|nr:hypothetical protein CK203_045430 [Vitis vinifera]
MDLPKKPDGNLDGFSTVSSSTRVFWNSRRRSGFIWKKKIVQLHGGGGGGVDFLGLGFLGGGFQTNLEIPMIPYLDKIESTEPLG